MNLLLEMLINVKFTSFKIRVSSIIGQLIRYATVIDNDFNELNIPDIFVQQLKDKNIKLKR